MFFSLWRDGGPDYIKEKRKWDLEHEAVWTYVHHSSKKSYAQIVVLPLKSRRNAPKSVFKILSFPNSYYENNFSTYQVRTSVFDRICIPKKEVGA